MIVKGRIDNWEAVIDNKEIDMHFHIRGEVNGSPIITSRVVKIGDSIVQTRNSIYKLGFPKIKIGMANLR